MRLIQDFLMHVFKTFQAKDLLHSKRQAEDFVCELLHCSRAQLYTNQLEFLSEEQEITAQVWLTRRLKGEPLAYLSGQVEFYACLIKVNPAVLIPRVETEVLVDKIATCLQKQDVRKKVLWDVCCGSGCIGIALKKKFPDLCVYLSDYSEKAIVLAADNAKINAVEVRCVKGDLLAPFQGLKAHYIVCNPPYISETEYADLDQEVKDYEPRLALVGGETGLEMYERLAHDLPNYLYAHAQVWLEIGYQQGNEIKKLFQNDFWKKSHFENDWAGHHRFFLLENE